MFFDFQKLRYICFQNIYGYMNILHLKNLSTKNLKTLKFNAVPKELVSSKYLTTKT